MFQPVPALISYLYRLLVNLFQERFLLVFCCEGPASSINYMYMLLQIYLVEQYMSCLQAIKRGTHFSLVSKPPPVCLFAMTVMSWKCKAGRLVIIHHSSEGTWGRGGGGKDPCLHVHTKLESKFLPVETSCFNHMNIWSSEQWRSALS